MIPAKELLSPSTLNLNPNIVNGAIVGYLHNYGHITTEQWNELLTRLAADPRNLN